MFLSSFLVNSTRAEVMSSLRSNGLLMPGTMLHTGLSSAWAERAGGLGEQPDGGQEKALGVQPPLEGPTYHCGLKKLVWQRQRDFGTATSWSISKVGSGPKDS